MSMSMSMSIKNLSATLSPIQRPQKRAEKVKDSVYLKRGTSDQIRREVEAIDFVRQHTSIPVLQIHVDEKHTTHRSSWFSMTAMSGTPLTDAWPTMTVEARSATQPSLRTYLHELRTIPCPTVAFIGSCKGWPAYDHRLKNG
jgi:hypothetical protein